MTRWNAAASRRMQLRQAEEGKEEEGRKQGRTDACIRSLKWGCVGCSKGSERLGLVELIQAL